MSDLNLPGISRRTLLGAAGAGAAGAAFSWAAAEEEVSALNEQLAHSPSIPKEWVGSSKLAAQAAISCKLPLL